MEQSTREAVERRHGQTHLSFYAARFSCVEKRDLCALA
jgi:hypothetical protein